VRATRAGLVIAGVVLIAACGKGKGNQAVFTEPPFTPEVTLAPSATPTGASGGSNQLQIQPLVGQTFVLHVAGFQPGEKVTFTITKPDGSSFTGPPHVVAQDGTVEARYGGSTPGTYTVLARGDRGDQAQTQFTVNGTFTSAPQSTARTTTRHTTTHTPTPTVHHTPAPTVYHTPSPTHTP
jgi:hypothetical protein